LWIRVLVMRVTGQAVETRPKAEFGRPEW
jgi:hypothetical protein